MSYNRNHSKNKCNWDYCLDAVDKTTVYKTAVDIYSNEQKLQCQKTAVDKTAMDTNCSAKNHSR